MALPRHPRHPRNDTSYKLYNKYESNKLLDFEICLQK